MLLPVGCGVAPAVECSTDAAGFRASGDSFPHGGSNGRWRAPRRPIALGQVAGARSGTAEINRRHACQGTRPTHPACRRAVSSARLGSAAQPRGSSSVDAHSVTPSIVPRAFRPGCDERTDRRHELSNRGLPFRPGSIGHEQHHLHRRRRGDRAGRPRLPRLALNQAMASKRAPRSSMRGFGGAAARASLPCTEGSQGGETLRQLIRYGSEWQGSALSIEWHTAPFARRTA